MFSFSIHAETVEDLKDQLTSLANAFSCVAAVPDTIVSAPRTVVELPVGKTTTEVPIKPVLTQAQMEENIAKAPAHELPPTPPIEEVRKALNTLKDVKGVSAVKALLKEYGANSVPELKEECYLQIRDRAYAEAGA